MPADSGGRGAAGRGQDSENLRDQAYVDSYTVQTQLLRKISDAIVLLAQAEYRESIAELVTARLSQQAATAVQQPTATAGTVAAPVEPMSVTGEDALVVLSQYDQLSAGLGRTGADSFFVAAKFVDGALRVSGPAVAQASRLMVGGTTVPRASVKVDSKGQAYFEVETTDSAAVELLLEQPPVRLWAGNRLIAVARQIVDATDATVTSSTSY
jgi:hypothetical protein